MVAISNIRNWFIPIKIKSLSEVGTLCDMLPKKTEEVIDL